MKETIPPLDHPILTRSDRLVGLIYLVPSMVITVMAQFVLKGAMQNLGAVSTAGYFGDYVLRMINPQVIGGLGL